jgi:hypothetical protein
LGRFKLSGGKVGVVDEIGTARHAHILPTLAHRKDKMTADIKKLRTTAEFFESEQRKD